MIKALIGSVCMLLGISISMYILMSSIMLVGSWSGSRLLTVISVNELGLPLTIGIILSFIGLVILTIEYFSKSE